MERIAAKKKGAATPWAKTCNPKPKRSRDKGKDLNITSMGRHKAGIFTEDGSRKRSADTKKMRPGDGGLLPIRGRPPIRANRW